MNTPSKQKRRRLPPWLTRRITAGRRADDVAALLRDLNLATVCDEARCPNRHECFCRGTATFMILGRSCTRRCRFCAVSDGAPEPLRDDEPDAVATAAARMGLRHVVITSVTRDDLPDGGAAHFARTVAAVRERLPDAAVEVLVPDFQGDRDAIATVLAAEPDVFNHNVETVPRLYPQVRPQAEYARSIDVLAVAARAGATVKSGLMAGLGETMTEVDAVLGDLRAAGCGILTVGQYLAPSDAHVPVARYVPPAEFDALKARAEAMGFAAVAAGPFVRSSYNAESVYRSASR